MVLATTRLAISLTEESEGPAPGTINSYLNRRATAGVVGVVVLLGGVRQCVQPADFVLHHGPLGVPYRVPVFMFFIWKGAQG